MRRFADAGAVYARIGRFFQEVAADPELGPRFAGANTVVRYELHDPEAPITIGMREGEPVQVDLGASEQQAEVVMSMDADLAEGYFLGEVDLTVALARGQILAEGPVGKILILLPLMEPVLPRYRALVSPDPAGGSAEDDEAPRPGL